MTGQARLWHLRRRRRARQQLSALSDLLATPADLATPLRMPAGARLAVSHSVGLTAGQATISLGNGAGFTTPTLSADAVHRGDWAERGQDVAVAGVPTGTLSLYIVDPLDGRHRLVATRVVAGWPSPSCRGARRSPSAPA